MQEPSRQLGWHTAVNNTITQIFLKARAIVIFFLIAAVLGTSATIFFWNGITKTEISIFNVYIEILKMGHLPEWKYTKFLLGIALRIFEHSLIISVLIFIVIFSGINILRQNFMRKSMSGGLSYCRRKPCC